MLVVSLTKPLSKSVPLEKTQQRRCDAFVLSFDQETDSLKALSLFANDFMILN